VTDLAPDTTTDQAPEPVPATSQRRRTAARAVVEPSRAQIVAAARAERPPLEVARRIVEVAEDKKAADIVLLDLAGVTTMADYFVICSGGSERQLGGIADGIIEGLKEQDILPVGREGGPTAHWVLLDYGAVIVHVMAQPERDYYTLEKLWSDAPLLLRVL